MKSDKTVVIMQPGYLPWLGFFELLHQSDTFVIYDNIQYDKHSWRNRNRIKTSQGAQWLTIPVLIKSQNKPFIKDVKIDNKDNWKHKHLLSIRQNYGRSEFFKQYFPLIEAVLLKKWTHLIDVDMEFIRLLSKELGIQREIIFASELDVDGGKTEKLIKMCKLLGASRFYEPAGGRSYINDEEFIKAGIKIEYQDYKHPVYNQLYGEFIPNLSVIDLLFNEGPRSLDILLT